MNIFNFVTPKGFSKELGRFQISHPSYRIANNINSAKVYKINIKTCEFQLNCKFSSDR